MYVLTHVFMFWSRVFFEMILKHILSMQTKKINKSYCYIPFVSHLVIVSKKIKLRLNEQTRFVKI